MLLSIACFAGEITFAEPRALLLIAYFTGTLVSGARGAWLAWCEGLFAPTGVRGGIPVELRSSTLAEQPAPVTSLHGSGEAAAPTTR